MTKTMLYPWQQTAWLQFVSMIQQQRLPHALLVSGVVGIGKKQFAEQMTATLLCLNVSPDGEACGVCHSCQLLKAGTHPDHTPIMPEETGKQIKIDQIRDLKAKQSLTTHIAPYKTVIINPADNMTTSAANSLLKLLEEPQQNTVLMLLTAAAEKLPITIRSRCQCLMIRTPDRHTSVEWLETQQKNSAIDWQGLLELAAGAPLTALALSETDTSWVNEIETDFQQLLRGQGNPVAMAQSWQKLEILSVMHHFQRNILKLLKQPLMDKQSDAQDVRLHGYWQIADCILNTIKLISSQNNFNKTLLIEDFMVSIKQVASRYNLN